MWKCYERNKLPSSDGWQKKRKRHDFPSCSLWKKKQKKQNKTGFIPVIISLSALCYPAYAQRHLNPLMQSMCCCEKHQSALRDSNSVSNPSSNSSISVFMLLLGLTSNMFISSISARVGALSRIRGRDDVLGPGSDMDRSMHEVDLTLQGQVWAKQGREPNAEGRESNNTVKKQVRVTEISQCPHM